MPVGTRSSTSIQSVCVNRVCSFTLLGKLMRAERQPFRIHWPSNERIRSFMSQQFQQLCPELIPIIDCTEIRMESPSSLDNKAACYSSYKSHSTMKALVGFTPNGVVSFMSEFYSGSISDPDIVKRSGYLEKLKKGDTSPTTVMAA